MAGNGKIEIERIIRERLETEGRTVKWFCKEIGWDRKKWYRFQNNGYIDVHDLRKICEVLGYDFFQCFSAGLVT